MKYGENEESASTLKRRNCIGIELLLLFAAAAGKRSKKTSTSFTVHVDWLIIVLPILL